MEFYHKPEDKFQLFIPEEYLPQNTKEVGQE
jgi:hypothetical protein